MAGTATTAQWTELDPASTTVTLFSGKLVQLPDGGWSVDPSGAPDAGLVAVAGGGFGADDSVTTGLPIVQTGSAVLTY